MTDIVLTGIVQEDGSVLVEGKVDMPPGRKLDLIVRTRTFSVSLEEAKIKLAEATQHEWTSEEEAEYHRLHAQLRDMAMDDTGLPEDYADEIDHYLYGTPKRSEE